MLPENLPDDWPRCEVCGEPATSLVQDVSATTYPDTREVHREPTGPVHSFCEAHERDSEEIRMDFLFTLSDGTSIL